MRDQAQIKAWRNRSVFRDWWWLQQDGVWFALEMRDEPVAGGMTTRVSPSDDCTEIDEVAIGRIVGCLDGDLAVCFRCGRTFDPSHPGALLSLDDSGHPTGAAVCSPECLNRLLAELDPLVYGVSSPFICA